MQPKVCIEVFSICTIYNACPVVWSLQQRCDTSVRPASLWGHITWAVSQEGMYRYWCGGDRCYFYWKCFSTLWTMVLLVNGDTVIFSEKLVELFCFSVWVFVMFLKASTGSYTCKRLLVHRLYVFNVPWKECEMCFTTKFKPTDYAL